MCPRPRLAPDPAAVCVIANPAAGGGRAAHIARQFAAPNAEVRYTRYPGHASQLAAEALAAGYRRIAVAGGDGTLHEVIQPLVGAVPPDFEIECLGGGTSCDFLKRAHRPGLTDIIQIDCHDEHGQPRRKFGVNAAHSGFVANATFHYNSPGILPRAAKRANNDVAMLAAAARTVTSDRPFRAQVAIEGRVDLLNLSEAAVFKTPWIGGGMHLTAAGLHDDGILGVVLLDACRRRDYPGLIVACYRNRVEEHPRVRVLRCREIAFATERPQFIQADGELIGYTPVRYTVLPRALRL